VRVAAWFIDAIRDAPWWARPILILGLFACVLLLYLAIASCLFVRFAGLGSHYPLTSVETYYQWLGYWPYRHRTMVALYLAASALLPVGVAAAFTYRFGGGWRDFRQGALGVGRVRRGTSLNHGEADWMDEKEQAKLFPEVPDDELGGVVVGERDRVDLGPVAKVPFDPEDQLTWGNGGSAPLLIDQCRRGPTHSMVIGGGGSYKSTTLITTLLTWRKSFFCLDPSEELADLVCPELERRGKGVVRLVIGGDGPNVLASIDITDKLAETRLRAVVGRIVGPIAETGDGKDNRFKKWGRTIILALAAHMLWEPDIPMEHKTLRSLRMGLSVGLERMRDILRGIAESSHSPLARSLAGSMWDMVHETFSGALGNATDDTEFLASDGYSSLMSGGAYNIRDLVDGNLCVFCQIPQEALEHTPAVARVLTGCHMDAVFAAKGNVNGRVFFPIDEAVLLGRDPALKVARDQGRKSKLTLQLFFQSEGQIEDIWGKAGKRAWFDGLSWRTYAGVQNLETAKEISGTLGTFGARAYSEGTNKGRSGRPMELSSSSKGSNTNEHEISRALAMPHELLSEMRDDERITIVRSRRAIRHGAAIAFRRPELSRMLGESIYRQEYRVIVQKEDEMFNAGVE
jgi:type IV secretion system protein VirD4